jgi:hypothetical protein
MMCLGGMLFVAPKHRVLRKIRAGGVCFGVLGEECFEIPPKWSEELEWNLF